MALHQITMSRTSTGDLYVIFLQNTQPFAFMQTADGVWHPTDAEGGAAIRLPNPGAIEFQAVRNMGDGYGLLALDVNNALWCLSQTRDGWNPGGFKSLGSSFLNFDACIVQGLPILVAGLNAANGYQIQFGGIGAMSAPANHRFWGIDVSAISIGVTTGPPEEITSTAVLFTGLQFATSSDGVNWWTSPVLQPPVVNWAASNTVLAVGNPNRTLQAIALTVR